MHIQRVSDINLIDETHKADMSFSFSWIDPVLVKYMDSEEGKAAVEKHGWGDAMEQNAWHPGIALTVLVTLSSVPMY